MALHLDSGRQRAPKYGHLGDSAVRVEQDVVHSVDRRVFDLQPEECGVVGLTAEDLFVGEVRRLRACQMAVVPPSATSSRPLT